MPHPRLDTARLHGAAICEADLEDFVAFYADPEVMRFLSPTGTPYAREAAVELLERHLAHWREHGFGTWVFRSPEGAFVGRAGLRSLDIDNAPTVELFYGVTPARWRRGYATEMAGGILDYAFETLGLERVVAFALPTNTASLAVLAKHGFVETGALMHAGLSHALFERARSPSGA